MNPIFKFGIVAVAAFVGLGVGKSIDGPLVQWAIAGLAAWVAWGMVKEA